MTKMKKLVTLALASSLLVGGLSGVVSVPYNVMASASVVEAPSAIKVPALAYDEKSINLVWQKPNNYSNIVDYIVYVNGTEIGKASENTASASQKYIKQFYKNYDPSGTKHVKVQSHTFTVTDLAPDTEYSFYIRSVDASGNLSVPSPVVTQKTTKTPEVFNVVDYGAVGDGTTLNTEAIQNTIDAATPGSKVLVPAGVFKTGAIWLKSDMTLEIAKGGKILGSENAEDYQFNYYHYDYMVNPRFYSLINAQSFDEGTLKNIRIVGQGVIDGNGWIWGNGDFVEEPEGGYADDQFPNQTVLNKGKPSGSTSDTTSAAYWGLTGVLAKSQTQWAVDHGLVDDAYTPASNLTKYQAPAYSSRSNLIMMKGVENLYYEGFTAINPANHTLVNAESKNVTVNGVKILTYDDNNADGIEFIHSDGLTVMNNVFDTGDDGMNFAAGQGAAGQQYPASENAWIFNNYFREAHGAVVTGSHTAAWIQNILAEDNVMNHTDVGLRMKTNSRIGGGAQNVTFRDNAMRDISGQAFIMTSTYDDANGTLEYEPSQAAAQFRNVNVKNISVDGTPVGIQVNGVLGGEHNNINFDNVQFWNATTPTNISYMKDSTFKDVVFNGSTNPWKITQSSGLKFSGTTTRGTATSPDKDQEVAPVWASDSKLNTVVGSTYANLVWSGASDNVKVSGYLVTKNGKYLNTLTSNSYKMIAAPTEASPYVASNLSPGLDYEFAVYAVDASGNITAGPAVKITAPGERDTVPPVVAANSAITLNGEANTTWLNFSWTAATDNYGINHYNVYQNGALVDKVYGATSFTASRLKFNTEYKFEIEAVDDAGNATKYPTPLVVRTLPAYDVTAPVWGSNSKLEASNVTTNSVQLKWNAASDDIAISGYRVYANGKPVQGDVRFLPVNSANTTAGTSYAVTGLESNTTYTFKVEAGDTANKWTSSGPSVTVTTAKVDKAPTWGSDASLKATDIRKTDLTLNWIPAKDDTAVIGYSVSVNDKVVAEVQGTSYSVKNLIKSTAYTFKVQARDNAGNWSDALTLKLSTPKDNGSGNDDKLTGLEKSE